MTQTRKSRLAALLLAMLLLSLAACGGGREPADADVPAVEETEAPTPTPLPDPDPELAELYGTYRDAVERLVSDTAARGRPEGGDVFDHGVFRDVDDDGWPELLVLYSPNGTELHAMIGRRLRDGSVRYLDIDAGLTGGEAQAAIMYGEVYDLPVVYVTSSMQLDGEVSGNVYMASIQDTGARSLYMLRWSEDPDGSNGAYYVDGVENEALFNELFDGIDHLVCSAPSDTDPTCEELIDELAALAEVYGRQA